jgi:hypothetical protein
LGLHCRSGEQSVEEAVGRALAVGAGCLLVFGGWDRDRHLLQVPLDLEELGSGGVLGGVEVTACAGHAVLALFEEGTGAVAVSEVVVLPGLAGRGGAGGDRVPVDQDLNGADVPLEARLGLGRNPVSAGRFYRKCDLGTSLERRT